VTRLVIVAVALLVSANLAVAADPTGTWLKVRESPNGKVTGSLTNGALVAIVEYKDADNGKPWVKIVDYKTKKPIGWVFREFVSCF